MAEISKARHNLLLGALPASDFDRLKRHLKPETLSLGEVLYESGEQMNFVYFPTTAIVSLQYIMENGATAEIGMTGRDGLVGIALFMGGSTTPNRAVVQSAGNAFRMEAKKLHGEFIRGGEFQHLYSVTRRR